MLIMRNNSKGKRMTQGDTVYVGGEMGEEGMFLARYDRRRLREELTEDRMFS